MSFDDYDLTVDWSERRFPDPLAEYEELRRGERPDGREWKGIPGPERVAVARRYCNPPDPDDPGPRWLECPCSEQGGAISWSWGHSPYCDRCGALL